MWSVGEADDGVDAPASDFHRDGSALRRPHLRAARCDSVARRRRQADRVCDYSQDRAEPDLRQRFRRRAWDELRGAFTKLLPRRLQWMAGRGSYIFNEKKIVTLAEHGLCRAAHNSARENETLGYWRLGL
jgi:hypothetical protein